MLRIYSIIFCFIYSGFLVGTEEYNAMKPTIIPLKSHVIVDNCHTINLDFDHTLDTPILSDNGTTVLKFSQLTHIAPFYKECREITMEGVALYDNKIVTAMVMQLKSVRGIFVDLINYYANGPGHITPSNGSRFSWIVANSYVEVSSIAVQGHNNQLCCIGSNESGLERRTDWLGIVTPYDQDEENIFRARKLLLSMPIKKEPEFEEEEIY